MLLAEAYIVSLGFELSGFAYREAQTSGDGGAWQYAEAMAEKLQLG